VVVIEFINPNENIFTNKPTRMPDNTFAEKNIIGFSEYSNGDIFNRFNIIAKIKINGMP
jgi:hypothetical protein